MMFQMMANFSSETTEAKNKRLLKEKKDCPLRISYLVKIPFKIKGEIQTFSD